MKKSKGWFSSLLIIKMIKNSLNKKKKIKINSNKYNKIKILWLINKF